MFVLYNRYVPRILFSRGFEGTCAEVGALYPVDAWLRTSVHSH